MDSMIRGLESSKKRNESANMLTRAISSGWIGFWDIDEVTQRRVVETLNEILASDTASDRDRVAAARAMASIRESNVRMGELAAKLALIEIEERRRNEPTEAEAEVLELEIVFDQKG